MERADESDPFKRLSLLKGESEASKCLCVTFIQRGLGRRPLSVPNTLLVSEIANAFSPSGRVSVIYKGRSLRLEETLVDAGVCDGDAVHVWERRASPQAGAGSRSVVRPPPSCEGNTEPLPQYYAAIFGALGVCWVLFIVNSGTFVSIGAVSAVVGCTVATAILMGTRQAQIRNE